LKENLMARSKLNKVIRTITLVGALGVALGAAGQAALAAEDGAGIRNCVEITGPQSGRVGCYELVWANGVQYKMTFSNTGFDGATPGPLDPFYVLAPQTAAPQGYPPNTFPHDHVVRAIPAQNHGTYSVRLQGFFVLCSGEGIESGACVPAWTNLGGPNPVPLATTVDGRSLTSSGAIEAAAAAGDLFLQNLGPGAVIVGSASVAR
jgi:hypothetical protein